VEAAEVAEEEVAEEEVEGAELPQHHPRSPEN